jgi:hypothetical protein
VLNWSSEEIIIPYKSPIDGKWHRYFPDFVIKVRNKYNQTETYVIEVKPYKETKEPEIKKRITKQYLYEVQTWGINSAKWNAAKEFCDDRKWKFKIITERELKIK